VRRLHRADVRQERDHLLTLGFVESGTDSHDHPVFTHPVHGRVSLPLTPSSGRWQENHRSQLARQMGISTKELKLRLGLLRPKSSRPKRQPRRRQKFIARKAKPAVHICPAVPEPVRVLSVEELIEKKSDERSQARRQGQASLAQRLDLELAELFARKRMRAA
jgi:hypothetical protein